MQEIYSLIANGEPAQAATMVDSRLLLDSADPELQYLAGVAKSRMDNADAALTHLQACVEANPDHALAHLALGRVQRMMGQPVAAQAAFDTAVFLQPELAGAHALAGELAAVEGDREQACARAYAALHEGAEDPQAPLMLSGLALQAGQYGECLELLKPFLGGGNVGPRVAQIAVAAYFMQQQYDQALQAVNLCSTGAAGMPAALRTLQVRVLLDARRPEVLQLVRTLTEEHTDSANAWSLVAETELARGQFVHAIEAADRALAIRPSSSVTVRTKAMAYLRASKPNVAEKLLIAQVGVCPGDVKSWRMLLAATIGSSDHAKAQETAQRWVETAPNEADAHGDLAALLEYNGDLDGAMLSARAALRAQPGHINALLIAARAELRIGRPGPVIAMLDRVHPAKLDLQQQLARLALLARAADANGDHEQAVVRWVEKQTLDPAALNAGMPKGVAETRIPAHKSVLNVTDPMPIVFLVGLPGSGVQHVAAALAKYPGICLMGDRFSHQARNDGFSRPDWQAFEDGLVESQATMMRRRWIKPLLRLNLPGEYKLLIDWLPHLDARTFAAIARAIPEAKFLLVERQAHDSLLDWLAFSGPHRMEFPPMEEAGQWYANALSHLQFASEDSRLPVHRLAYERASEAEIQSELLQWLGLDAGSLELDQPATLGGLPAQFAAGHSQEYKDELRAAFSKLAKA